MKQIAFSLFLMFTITLTYSQVENDSIQINQIKEEKLNRIVQWENQIEKARKNGDLSKEMNVMMELASFRMSDFADYSSAYEELRYLEKLVAKNPNEPAVIKIEAKLNCDLGWVLRDQNNFEEALNYFDKGLLIAKKHNEIEFYKYASCDRAELLVRMGRKDDAFNHLRRMEKEAIVSSDSVFRNRVYEVIASIYLNENEIDSSLYYSKKSIDVYSQPSLRSYRLFMIGRCFLLLDKEIDSAVFYAEKALKIALDSGLEKEENYAHDLLKEAYHKLGNDKKAYYHFEKFYKLEQKQKSYQNALSIGNLNLKREKEASSLEQALSAEKLSNQRIIIWLVLIVIVLLILGIFSIIHRFKFISKQNKIIEQGKLRAEQSERFKEQFLANMSHEIRTPLHAISGMINSLERNSHPESQNIFLDAMKTSSENLLVLLNDILDLSKIDSGKLEIEEIPINPIEVVDNVVKTLQYRAAEKGLELQTEIDQDFPNRIIGDPSRLNQILINLVGNAIKFTDKGYVKIIASKSEDYLEFAIKDTGPGISEDQVDLIFEVFKQGEKSKSQILGGTGLGLSISKQLVELQNGTLKVESVFGEGSTFYVKLPIKKAEPFEDVDPLYGEEQIKEMGRSLKGIKILLVEDDDFNVLVVQDDLTYYIPEVNITVVKNGEEAINKFSTQDFDVILMDKHMPILGGCEASEKIRELERQNQTEKRVPMIAMTASLLKSEIEECINAGMDGYIPKPYKPEQLVSTLYNFMKSKQ
jgi:signal transduction histidine kinase/CheY-like chemotaxis protein